MPSRGTLLTCITLASIGIAWAVGLMSALLAGISLVSTRVAITVGVVLVAPAFLVSVPISMRIQWRRLAGDRPKPPTTLGYLPRAGTVLAVAAMLVFFALVITASGALGGHRGSPEIRDGQRVQRIVVGVIGWFAVGSVAICGADVSRRRQEADA